jgi:hypothetical protein
MSLKKNGLETFRLKAILIVAGLVFMTLSLASRAGAQETEARPNEAAGVSLEELYMAPGVLVAAATEKQASGRLQLQSYKIEEVKLSRPIKFEGTPEPTVFDTVLRLTVILGSPLQGPYTIFVDDEPQTAVVTQRNGISVIFFNPSQLEDGAQISVASGRSCNISDASVLKTRIRLPEGRKQPQRADADPGYSVKKIRTLRPHPGLRDRDEVEIQLTTRVPFAVSNAPLVMQVGDLRVMGGYGADPRTLVFRMSAEEFSRAEDGKRIRVKYGRCSGGGTRFGILNKAQLDQ